MLAVLTPQVKELLESRFERLALLTPQVLTAGRRRHLLTLALQAVGVTSVGEASLEVMLHRYLQVGGGRATPQDRAV